jgi:leucyl/phenylalanyl-tRNA---protein transferase
LVTVLTKQLIFPDVSFADTNGLLAVGGDCSPERLLLAYQNGIFPWPEDDLLVWYCPPQRMVLLPNEVVVSKSMQRLINKNVFTFTFNTAFNQVINACATVNVQKYGGTWINNEIIAGYKTLHKNGQAFSAECWQNGHLVGGLYGVIINQVFCGESMFSTVSNASKFTFIKTCQKLATQNITLIDCQVYTPHLASLGAYEIPRANYLKKLQNNLR